jgi:hypothetical protein
MVICKPPPKGLIHRRTLSILHTRTVPHVSSQPQFTPLGLRAFSNSNPIPTVVSSGIPTHPPFDFALRLAQHYPGCQEHTPAVEAIEPKETAQPLRHTEATCTGDALMNADDTCSLCRFDSS